MSAPRTSGIFATDDWVLAEGSSGGKPLIVRMRSTLPAEADQSLFRYLLIIRWAYEPNERGMPDSDTHKLMNAFEDALEAGTEQRLSGVQAVSLTGDGKKEWRYYTAEVDGFIESLNVDLVGHPHYPLQIESFVDEDWRGLRDMQGEAS